MDSLVLPIKGRELYTAMRNDFDYSVVEWTIRRYNSDTDLPTSRAMVDAFLQWASLAPLNREDQQITMFVSPVEEAFHSFVLNTRLYQEFCDRFLGFFFHHEPLTDGNGPEVEALARRTVSLLQQEFGNELHPLLRDWVCAFENGNYVVACVGPGGHCPDKPPASA